MSETGLRMMGRDPQGNAQGIGVTDEGAVKTQVTGSIIIDGNLVNIAKNKKYNASIKPEDANLAFDEKKSEDVTEFAWRTSDLEEEPLPHWIEVEFNGFQSIRKLTMWGRDGSSTIRDFILQGSDDGDVWNDVFEGTLEANDTYQHFDVLSDNMFKRFRLYVLNNHGSETTVAIHDIRMYSVEKPKKISEYGWVDGDTEPKPNEFAFGVRVNPSTGQLTTLYWDGSEWNEVSD